MTKKMKAPRNPARTFRNYLTNLSAPVPLPYKIYALGRNISIRVVTAGTCCGHPGEPGC